jgi:hypothetical protein
VSPFPALDPEPPPRPFWRAALIPGSVTLGVVAVVVLAVTLPGALRGKDHQPHQGPTAASSSWSAQVPGEIIGWSAAGHTLLATSLSGFGVLTSPGHVSYLENGGLTLGPPPFAGSLKAGDVYGLSPFAGDDIALVIGGITPQGPSETPALFDTNSSNRTALPGGIADQVIGDPGSRGAWVTVVAGALPAGNYVDPQQADSRVEYRTPHKPPVTLATASRLRQLAGFRGNPSVRLTPYPSRSGKEIAIDVLVPGSNLPAPEVVVVLTRKGQLVAKLSVPGLQQLRWSSNGDKLLVLRSSGSLTTWAPGSPPDPAVHLPHSLQGWGSCLFAPTSKYILCAGFGSGNSVTKWALIRLSDRAVLTEPANTAPADWSP